MIPQHLNAPQYCSTYILNQGFIQKSLSGGGGGSKMYVLKCQVIIAMLLLKDIFTSGTCIMQFLIQAF